MNRAEQSNIRLVAIDDDAVALELVGEALKTLPLGLLTAQDPEQGLELVLRERPQIVLLDLAMPKMSGMELLDRIVVAAPDTEVVLLTGDSPPDSAVEAIRRGASDYLTKPVSVTLLRERISRYIEQARQWEAA